MSDLSRRKSSGYCRGKYTLRTITTTKWELPIPGSKPYWDKICDDLEQRKEHVSDFSHPPSPSSEAITDSNLVLNCDESRLTKLNHMVEPIVKISPPTPMRMVPESREFTITGDLIVNEYDSYRANGDHGSKNSNLSNGFSPVNEITAKKDANLYEISISMTEFLKNSNVQTKKSCQIHKNTPPLKIFDDNLKRFLPKKKVTKKLPSAKIHRRLPSNALLDFSKLHRNKSCPLRGQSVSKDRVEIGISSTASEHGVPRPLRPSWSEKGPGKKKANGDFGQFLKVPESPYVNVRSGSKCQISDRESKSKILMSNLDHMLSIPKLNDLDVDGYFTFDEEAITKLDPEQQIRAFPDEHNTQASFPHSRELDATRLETVKLRGTGSDEKLEKSSKNENVRPSSRESFEPTSSHSVNLPRLSDELSVALEEEAKRNDKSRVGSVQLRDQLGKDFLKVPKLGATSSYPSFSKLTPGYSVEAEEGQKPVVRGSSGTTVPQNVGNSAQEMESSCKRDFLKVPKLSMMSSYPSFNSLIPESLDSDDNTTSAPELISKRMSHETSSNISGPSNLRSTQDTCEERLDEGVVPSVSSSQTEKPKRRHSLKDSVRYAYRALKFMTPNKNLDFQPQSYRPTQKSGSTTGSSDSSRDSKYSKFEPVIKILTYEDIDKDRPPLRSVSSSTYGTVRSRLKQSASQYLGSNYVFSSSKARPATPSTTIPSLTRSTSGPTLAFQEPVFERPSEKVLRKLPKMSIYPRKKYDKCFACLHEAFKEPVKSRRELPLTTLNAVAKEMVPTLSESDSSSISLPDVKDFAESQSDYEDNWTEVLRSTKRSSLLEKTDWRSSKGLFRTNLDSYRSRQPLVRASEESQSLKSDAKIENLRKNVSSKDSIATNSHSKPLSLSSEHSKPSSISGHSSESDEPQVQVKQAVQTSECFVSPYAPSHWAPPLEPLKSLKLRKPVSMHGRAVSITKTEDDSTSDENANDYRSTRKEGKLNNTSGRKVADKNEDGTNVDASSQSVTNFGEHPNLTKQPSIIGKIITSQLSTVANFAKTQSRVDLLSNIPKSEDQSTSATDIGGDDGEETSKKMQKVEASLPDEKETLNLETNLHPVDVPDEQHVDGQSVQISLSKSSLPVIIEKSSENGILKDTDGSGTDNGSVSGETEHAEESEDVARETSKIYSSERVIEILEKCVEENRTPSEMLEALSTLVTQNDPFTSKETLSIPEIARSAKIAENLMKLLIDSKKYLNPDTFSPNLQFSSPQTPLCNPRQLRRVLPNRTYNLVARILGMPENPADKSIDQKTDFQSGHQAKDPFKLRQSRNRGPTADSCDMIVHPPSARGGRRLKINEDGFEYPKQSPYALFMNKPRRKAIKWRPLTERDMLGYDPEATLNMRATRVTNKICEDFCEWLRGLGGGHSEDIDEEVLRDMFQIEFTAEACRNMQVLIKEIPMVPIAVAVARNTPGAGELALTRRHLIRDAKAEKMPKKVIGFGSILPHARRFVPPQNRVAERWLQCENVPHDLETMETVWKGITHLDSVKGFLAWVKAHPGVKPPKILTEAYAKKEAPLNQPSAEEASGQIELEMDQIESLKVGDVE